VISVLRYLLEGLRWLWGAGALRVAGKSGISQVRIRLGEVLLRRLYEQVVQPGAMRVTKRRREGVLASPEMVRSSPVRILGRSCICSDFLPAGLGRVLNSGLPLWRGVWFIGGGRVWS